MVHAINRPVAFGGTSDEADANFATHQFGWEDEGDARCWRCDCRPSHAAASYPCGTEPPRETVVWVDGVPFIHGEGTEIDPSFPPEVRLIMEQYAGRFAARV